MARLHIDIANIEQELDIALGVLRTGGQVLLERNGSVIAELVVPGTNRASRAAALPGDMLGAMPIAAAEGRDPFDAAMDVLRAQGAHSMETWDELNREEALLEYLASEFE